MSDSWIGRVWGRLRGSAAAEARHRELLKRLDHLTGEVDALSRQVDHVAATQKQLRQVLYNQKLDEKFRIIFRKQLGALVRAQYIPTAVPAPLALQARRFRLRSQHEEDGIILALLDATGVETRRFVEIGSGGSGGNSATLAYDMGWGGVMIDASPSAIKAATREFRWNKDVKVVQAFVTSDNVNELITTSGGGGEIDLLSIDLDSIDYWVLDALEACRPRVLVVEYNAHLGPKRSVTLPNAMPPPNPPVVYFGASLAALAKAAGRKNYDLVLCEDAGVNAFFVRRDLAPSIPRLSPKEAFRPFKHRDQDPAKSIKPEQAFDIISRAGLPLVEV